MLERYPEIKKTFDTFINCFAAGDGGVGMIKFAMFLEQMGKEWDEGNPAAGEIIGRVQAVGRLVTHVTGVTHEL